MADAATTTPSEAEQKMANKAKIARMERQEAMEAEEAATKSAPSTPVVAHGNLAPTDNGFRQAMPRDRQFVDEAFNRHAVRCRAVTPKEAMDNRFLWSIQHKLKRWDTVLLYDEAFRWEVTVRVMHINSELQIVEVSPLHEVIAHDIVARGKIDWALVTLEHKGAVDKWTIMFGRSKIKPGFETEEEARDWIDRRKQAAA